MPESLIERALGTATDTKAIEIGRGVVARTGDVFAALFPGRTAIIVADENHWRVAGEQAAASLTAAGVPQAEPYIFPGTPTLYAGYDNIETLRDAIAGLDAVVVAVASGTLNDIAKRAVVNWAGRTSASAPPPRWTATPRSVRRSARTASSRPSAVPPRRR